MDAGLLDWAQLEAPYALATNTMERRAHATQQQFWARGGHPPHHVSATGVLYLGLCRGASEFVDPGGRRRAGKNPHGKAGLGEGACWIEGNATPFGMYTKLYRYRDKFVVIDDVDSLYADLKYK